MNPGWCRLFGGCSEDAGTAEGPKVRGGCHGDEVVVTIGDGSLQTKGGRNDGNPG